MSRSAQQIADSASFQAFMNCYLRELDSGVWHSAQHWSNLTGLSFNEGESYVIELQLPSQQLTLAVGVGYRSLVGRHTLTRIYQQPNHQLSWQSVEYFSVLMLLVNEIYGATEYRNQQVHLQDALKTNQLELMARIIESHQVMTRYLESRADDNSLNSERFIDSEQSLLFGHWLHPTPKSRQGIHEWQHQDYTPEMCGQFQLHYFAAQRSLVKQRSILGQSAEQIILSNLNETTPELNDQQVLLPVHPLQAQWLLHQDYIIQLIENNQLSDIGPLGPLYTPTSSVRTVYSEDSNQMFKLSIPVKVTNSLRINMHHELEAGVVVANLLRLTEFSKRYPTFQTINDPAYISLELPNVEQSGFEVIIRDNPFKRKKNDDPSSREPSVHSIAAITQNPIDEQTPSRLAKVIMKLTQDEQRTTEAVSLEWFDRYWDCAIEPAIRLYDQHGIALEAHQQNSLLDVTEGYPSQYFYRDNQGFYLSESHRQSLIALEPKVQDTEDLFYTDEMICDRFTYYLVVNQLFSIINRFGIDDLINEAQLLKVTSNKLQQLQPSLKGVGVSLVTSILNRREIPCKGNLLTRIDDVDELQAELELAVYTSISNPLLGFASSPRVNTHISKSREVHLEPA
ncbi:IucA/IucC family protein [Alkalimarinus coralli]|uniref:IucA/IucC family protein n=1 Tax=Alkalimarinus coralli TaxID=2935863 RepID=UPI00202AF211|nr:IucA/IucC family protein [Alkalimarinus coralli]